MRRSFALVTLTLLITLAASPAFAKWAQEVAVEALAERYAAAWVSGDAETLAALHQAEGVLGGADGTVVEGRAAIRELFTQNFQGLWKNSTITLTLDHMQPLAGDVVVVEGRFEIAGGFAGTTTGGFMQTVTNTGGEWLIADTHVFIPLPVNQTEN